MSNGTKLHPSGLGTAGPSSLRVGAGEGRIIVNPKK